MTELPAGYTEDEPWEERGALWLAEKPSLAGRMRPEHSSCMTWAVPQVGVGQPVQILQRQPTRFKAKLVVTNAGTSLIFNNRLDPLQGATPQGFTINAVGSLPDWESQQPLYVIGTGTGGSVSVWDEIYALQ